MKDNNGNTVTHKELDKEFEMRTVYKSEDKCPRCKKEVETKLIHYRDCATDLHGVWESFECDACGCSGHQELELVYKRTKIDLMNTMTTNNNKL